MLLHHEGIEALCLLASLPPCLLAYEHFPPRIRIFTFLESAAARGHVLDVAAPQPDSGWLVWRQYVLPALASACSEDTSDFVRVAYAANIGSLAETAQRFLDTAHERRLREARGREGEDATGAGGKAADGGQQQGYDAELAVLQVVFAPIVSES
jgi:hypothetical protein